MPDHDLYPLEEEDERSYIALELRRLESCAIEPMINHYGLNAQEKEVILEPTKRTGGQLKIWRYDFDEQEFVVLARGILEQDDAPQAHQIAAITGLVLIEDLWPAFESRRLTWKFAAWIVTLASHFPYVSAPIADVDSLKIRLEKLWPDAIRGQKSLQGAREGGKQKGEAYAKTAEEWQQRAEEIWSKNPKLSKSAVARIIAKETGGSVGSIRKKITNPFLVGK